MATAANPFENPFPFWWPWPTAPTALTQPILPGWSFGNITINGQNSSAPATEAAIVAEESYGRQIGKLLDAVALLIARQADGKPPQAFAELLALRTRVEAIKTDAAKRRVGEIARDLQRLKDADPAAYETEAAALKAVLLP